jgi:protein-S-isoprenylcysteine O-methyltransferase Ste14
MNDANDHARVLFPPPIAWALAFLIGLGLDWVHPLPFIPDGIHRGWIGGALVALGVLLALSAIAVFRKAGTRVEPYKPTTAIVANGPFAFTRNPIYMGMFLGQIGLGIALNSLWIVAMLVPLFLVIRNGVVAREEAYLESKFGQVYLDYKSRVRRWL